MSADFVDPRTDPDPGAARPPARFTADQSELADLHQFCREGRLYDVERWIAAGRPLQLTPGTSVSGRERFRTALEIALDRQDHSLVLLLAANGYDFAAEPECPLDTVLQMRRRDLLDLLLEWGADPLQVDVGLLCETYDSELFERFRRLGVELTSGHALAYALGYHTSNKPLYGYAKRHRLQDPKVQEDLDIALAHHAGEGNEKGVMLCLWAGADPHAQVPDLRWGLGGEEDDEDRSSAVRVASFSGHSRILERLEPDPVLDDFDALYLSAPNEAIIEVLARFALPKDPSRVVVRHLQRLGWSWRQSRPIATVRALFELGVQWRASPADEIAEVRQSLLKANDWTFKEVLKLLAQDDHCSSEVLTELARTPSIRKKMKRLRFIPESWPDRSEFDRSSPSRGREILARFGIEMRKERTKTARRLPPRVRIGPRRGDGTDLRLDRAALFDRVWSTPVSALAEEWGLSDRGLAKACRRLQIPVPPRGYWAKKAAGKRVRRPKLPELPAGQAEEIVIQLSRRANGE